jgi:hypothetical protein
MVWTIYRRPCVVEHKAAFLFLDNPFQQLLTNPKICPESDLSSAGIYVKLYVLIFRECKIGTNACLQDTFQAPG